MVELFNSRIHHLHRLPRPQAIAQHGLLIYDREVVRKSKWTQQWVNKWPFKYAVRGGEDLKDLDRLSGHIKKILSLVDKMPLKDLKIVALGGGSVGDFTGFVASILKRGVSLVQIPSTWLAAVDSAHGGKTALNVGSAKNQIGTFYPAEDIYIVESLLKAQPRSLDIDGLAELIKIALLDRDPWARSMLDSQLNGRNLIFEFIEPGICAKWKVVKKDPFEKIGHRRILNLGHSLAHVIELHHGISHGRAVALGLHFSLRWSLKRDYISQLKFARLHTFLERHLAISKVLAGKKLTPLRKAQFIKLSSKDKKSSADQKFYFIFLKGQGYPVQKQVSLSDFYLEAKQQGWAR